MKKKAPANKALMPIKQSQPVASAKRLLDDIRSLIERSRQRVSRTINSELPMLYWNIGRRIRQDILKEKRAAYGEEIVTTLSALLRPEYGEGLSRRNLFRMIRFAEVFPDTEIVSTLSAQLGYRLPTADEKLY